MSASRVVVLQDADALAWEAASRVAAAARLAVAERGQFTVALSGGSTPLRLFALLALAEWQVRVPWERTHVYWVDERCVPPEHPDSNFGAAHRALLSRLSELPAEVHRWHGEASDPAVEAGRYADLLRRDTEADARGTPVLDLVLLGMGADGHTASLFPHTEALHVAGTPTAANFVPQLGSWRLTLTYPPLEVARQVLILVAGGDKARTLRQVLHGPRQPEALPVQRLLHGDGGPVWLVDAEAAVALEGKQA